MVPQDPRVNRDKLVYLAPLETMENQDPGDNRVFMGQRVTRDLVVSQVHLVQEDYKAYLDRLVPKETMVTLDHLDLQDQLDSVDQQDLRELMDRWDHLELGANQAMWVKKETLGTQEHLVVLVTSDHLVIKVILVPKEIVVQQVIKENQDPEVHVERMVLRDNRELLDSLVIRDLKD